MGDSWVPISKAFRYLLPLNRPYSELEAALSLQLDFDEKKQVCMYGYSKLWQWGIKKVRLFFEKMGVTIEYPEDTKNKPNQRGYLKKIINLGTNLGTKKGQIREQISFIDIKYLQNNRNKPGNKPGAATIDPLILNPKEKRETKISRSLFLERVYLTDEEYRKLIEEMGKEKADYYIRRINDYIGSHPDKHYPDHYATIVDWYHQDQEKQEVKDDNDGFY